MRFPHIAMLHQRRWFDLVRSWNHNVQSGLSHLRTSEKSPFASSVATASATGTSRASTLPPRRRSSQRGG
jgi:hypothetical protein